MPIPPRHPLGHTDFSSLPDTHAVQDGERWPGDLATPAWLGAAAMPQMAPVCAANAETSAQVLEIKRRLASSQSSVEAELVQYMRDMQRRTQKIWTS